MTHKNQLIGKKDMNGKEIQEGHIVAVRYVWNSYVGVIRKHINKYELCLAELSNRHHGFAPYHDLSGSTYQIIGHTEANHPDYNYDVCRWVYSEEGDCPVKITVYDNYAKETEHLLSPEIKEARKRINDKKNS